MKFIAIALLLLAGVLAPRLRPALRRGKPPEFQPGVTVVMVLLGTAACLVGCMSADHLFSSRGRPTSPASAEFQSLVLILIGAGMTFFTHRDFEPRSLGGSGPAIDRLLQVGPTLLLIVLLAVLEVP